MTKYNGQLTLLLLFYLQFCPSVCQCLCVLPCIHVWHWYYILLCQWLWKWQLMEQKPSWIYRKKGTTLAKKCFKWQEVRGRLAKKEARKKLGKSLAYLLTTSFHPSSLFWPRLGLAMVSFPFGEERGEGPDFVQVDKELLVTSLITSDNL